MAKIKLGPQFLHLSRIGTLPELNYRQAGDYGDDKEMKALKDALAVNGWASNETIDVLPATEEQMARLAERLQARWEHLKSNAKNNVDAFNEYTMFEKVHLDSKGQLIVPDFVNNDGFRRLRIYEAALIQRSKIDAANRNGSEEFPMDIPVNVVDFGGDEAARIAQQLADNEQEGMGRREVGFVSKLIAAKVLFESGYNEAKLTNIFKRGTSQKLHSFLLVNARQPAVKLYERSLIEDTNDERDVPAQSFNPKDLRDLTKEGKIPSVQEVEDLIIKVKSGEKDAPVASKKEMADLKDQNPNPIVKMVITGYQTKNFAEVGKVLAPLAPHCDELLKWGHKLPELLTYLQAFKG